MPTTIGGTSHYSFVQSYNYNHCAGNFHKSPVLDRKQHRLTSVSPSILAGDESINFRNKKQKVDNSQNLKSGESQIHPRSGVLGKSPQPMTLKMLENAGELQDLDFDSDMGEINNQFQN